MKNKEYVIILIIQNIMIMDTLVQDIVVYITTFLKDKNIINFLSACSHFHLLKDKITYQDIVNINKIYDLWYYNNFSNVNFKNDGIQFEKFPKATKYINACFSVSDEKYIKFIPHTVTHLQFDIYEVYDPTIRSYIPMFFFTKDSIPKFITHLTFGDSFDEDIMGCIPNSVTHLTFGRYFNRSIKDCIPNSVTHLTFGSYFNQDIKGCIPNSVTASLTHLTFGSYFNQPIKDCIPNSVTASLTHLTFGYHFNQPIKDCIPTSVKYLKFSGYFKQDIKNYLPDSLLELKLHRSYPNDKYNEIKVNGNCKIIRY